MIWNENDHELHETSLHHRGCLKLVEWNPSGSRLATTDTVRTSFLSSYILCMPKLWYFIFMAAVEEYFVCFNLFMNIV